MRRTSRRIRRNPMDPRSLAAVNGAIAEATDAAKKLYTLAVRWERTGLFDPSNTLERVLASAHLEAMNLAQMEYEDAQVNARRDDADDEYSEQARDCYERAEAASRASVEALNVVYFIDRGDNARARKGIKSLAQKLAHLGVSVTTLDRAAGQRRVARRRASRKRASVRRKTSRGGA